MQSTWVERHHGDERLRAVCDMCGAEITPEDMYYELPDGLIVCAESDCLEDWAREYKKNLV